MNKPAILVVDDNPVIRQLLGTVLGRGGFSVHLAASGVEAIGVFEREPEGIDLVLLDIQLGDGPDGPETLTALRATDPGVRCCFMSADTGRYSVEQLEALGALAFFAKPFPDLPAMLQRLRSLVYLQPARRPA